MRKRRKIEEEKVEKGRKTRENRGGGTGAKDNGEEKKE